MWITRRTNRPDAANEGPVRARLARDKNAAVYLINRIAFIAGKPRSHMRRHFFRGTGFSRESDIPDNTHLSAVPASSRLKPVPRHSPRTEITPVGARLARDKNAAVYLINRNALIAGKPRFHMKSHFFRGTGFSREGDIPDNTSAGCTGLFPAKAGPTTSPPY